MAIYAIADLHLSFGSSKPMDIFSGWDNYTDRLKENWERVVAPSDTVIIAGDLSWALKLEQTRQDFEFINSLPGKKLILKGNHDYWWSTRKKTENFLDLNQFSSISLIFNSSEIIGDIAICGTRGWSYDCCTNEDIKILNREVGRLKASIESAKNKGKEIIVFLHYPPVYSDYECKEIIDVLLENKIKKCYYGHLHGQKAFKKAVIGNYKGINFNVISADLINFCPVLVSK